jgi:hypothetical protein
MKAPPETDLPAFPKISQADSPAGLICYSILKNVRPSLYGDGIWMGEGIIFRRNGRTLMSN